MLNRPQGPFFPGCEMVEAIRQIRSERQYLETSAVFEKDPVIQDLCAELFFRLEEREKNLYEARK